MQHHTDIPIERILWCHFQPGRRDLAREALKHMFAHCFSKCISYQEGPLRQALILSYLEMDHCDEVDRNRHVVIVYLHLRSGLVYGFSATGNLEHAITRLTAAGAWLDAQLFEVDRFAEFEKQLGAIFEVGCASGLACIVELYRHAPVMPDDVMAGEIIDQHCRDVFNEIAGRFGFIGENFPSNQVRPHFSRQYGRDACAIAQFRAQLDPDALAHAGEIAIGYADGTAQLSVYNFFTGGDVVVRRNRAQAIEQLPWLAPLITQMNVEPWTLESLPLQKANAIRRKIEDPVRQIVDAIDAGKPLFDAVSQSLNIPRETVRWSRGKVLPEIGYFDCFQADILLVALSWLPAEKRPVTPLQWIQFGELVCDCIGILSRFNYRYSPGVLSSDPPADSLSMVRYGPLAAILSCWLRGLIQMDIACAARRVQRAGQGSGGIPGIVDFLSALYGGLRRFCVNPSRRDGQRDPDADFIQAWLGTKTVGHLLALSNAWHRGIHAVNRDHAAQSPQAAVVHENADEDGWPAVMDAPFIHGERSIAEITSPSGLVEEGKAMRHCIGGYTNRCMRELRLIYSVRDIDGQRISTAELSLGENDLKVKVAAHLSFRNHDPDIASVIALGAMVRKLNSPRYVERMRLRVDYCHAQHDNFDGMTLHDLRSVNREEYERRTAAIAWECAFKAMPEISNDYPRLHPNL